MSPAAVDFPPPFTSPPQTQSKQHLIPPQIPNPNLHSPSTVGAFPPNNLPEQHPSVLPNAAADGGFACGAGPPFAPGKMSSESPNPNSNSAVSGRRKPRLAKMRRQLGFQREKSTPVPPPQNDSGLTCFHSVSENSNRVKNAGSTNTSDGFIDSIGGDVMRGKVNDKGFVFGANKSSVSSGTLGGFGSLNDVSSAFGVNMSNSDSSSTSDQVNTATSSNTSNAFKALSGDVMHGNFNNGGFAFGSTLNPEKKQSSGTMGQASKDGFGSFNNVGFVFGVGKCNSDSYSNPEHKESSEDVGKSGDNEFRKSEDLGVLFSDDKNSSLLHLNLGNGQCGESRGKSGADKFVKIDKGDFQFGANKNSYTNNSKSVKRQDSGSVQQSYADEFGGFNDVGFVFGANRSNLVSNESSEQRESRENAGQLHVDELGKFENGGCVFGTNNSSFMNLDKSQYRESAGKSEPGEIGKFDRKQFGSKPASSVSGLNFKAREPSINVGMCCDSCEGRAMMKEENKSELRKLDNISFVFGSKQGNLTATIKEKESRENIEKWPSGGRGKVNSDSGKVDDVSFVFGGNWSELRSNISSVKNESNENGGKSVPIDNQKMKSGAQLGKVDKTGFVFGACSKASSSIPDFQKRELCQNAGNLSFEDCGKIEVDSDIEFQKAEANDVFIFGSRSKKNSCYSGSTKPNDEMNKVNHENSGNYTGFANTYGDMLGSVVNSKSSFASGTTSNTTSASGTSTVRKLSEEMRKMTVTNCEKIVSSSDTKGPDIDSSASSNHVFVFGSDKNSPASFTGKTGTPSCDQNKNEHLHDGVVERTEGVNVRTIEENIAVFANSKKAACLPNENDQQMRRGEGFLDGQIKLGFSCGSFWEEKQPKNVNKNSTDDPSVGTSISKPFTFPGGLGKVSDGPREKLNKDPELNITSNGSLFSSSGHCFEAPCTGRVESKGKFSFTSTPVGVGTSVMDFGTSNGDTSFSFAVNLSPSISKSGNTRSVREKRWKKTRGKLRQAFPVQQQSKQNHVSKEDSLQEIESPHSYSPMDFSPYQDNSCAPSPSDVKSSAPGKDEDLATVSEGANIIRGDKKCGKSNEEDSFNHNDRVGDSSLKEGQTECSNSRSEQISVNGGGGGVAGHGVSSNMKREESECKKQFCFASGAEDICQRNFTFSASSTQDSFSATKRPHQKKYKMKVGLSPHFTTPSQKADTASSSVQFSPLDSSYLHPGHVQDKEGNFSSQRKEDRKSEGEKKDGKQGSTDSTQKACQKWRIRGNQAYEKGYLSKAEEFYTKGINSVPHCETSGCCIEPLVLCYSNRAAARMTLGRMREALGDCKMAAALDPNFHKVQIRAANCHLALGEIEGALQYFGKCIESRGGVCLDRRVMIEAANGLQKAQKVAKCMSQCAELLQQRTSNAAVSALEIISLVLSISSYSERILEMKGEALLMLRRYEEVIQLCEQTLVFAEKNFTSVAGDNNLLSADGPTYNNSSIRLWRWHLISKSYFHLGRLDLALDFIEKQELFRSSEDRCGSNSQKSSIPFAVTVRELLHRKNAGNEAYQSGRHTEAVEHYTAAVSSSIESHPFAAICFCNRAAAHQAMGQIADAIADCSLAMALDVNYSKAVSRRATLHEMIRDYEQAASDLQILVSLLEKQSQQKGQESHTPNGPTGSIVKELTQTRRRLYLVEEKAKMGISLDHYLILGIKQSDTESEIKKAYRKAALRHHPDKAGQFLAKSESGDDGKLWKEIADAVHKDADRLFKMIGEAYAVLSDPMKRSKYDLEEELRNDLKERNGRRDSRGSPEFYRSPSRSSANWQYRQGSWKTYGHSDSHW